MNQRALRLLEQMTAAGASADACRHAYAGEIFVTPVRKQLRSLGFSGELAEDVFARIATMRQEDVLDLWRVLAAPFPPEPGVPRP